MSSYLNQTYVDGLTAEWGDDDFNSRRLITGKKEFVHGSPTEIPVKVDFSTEDRELYFALTQRNRGALLRVYTSDMEEVPCEAGVRIIEGATVGQIRLFFLAPALSSENDTTFWLYYGSKEEASKTFKDADVWLPVNDGVWHDGCEVVGAYAKMLGKN